MGQNLTRSRRLQVVLGTPLSNYLGKPWVLVCACRDCAAEVDLPVAALLPAYGGSTIRQVLAKLRCQRCGGPPTGVAAAEPADQRAWLGPT